MTRGTTTSVPTYLPPSHFEALYELLDLPDLDIAVGGGLLVRHRWCAWGRVVAVLYGRCSSEEIYRCRARSLARRGDDDGDDGVWHESRVTPRVDAGLYEFLSISTFLSLSVCLSFPISVCVKTLGINDMSRSYRTDPVRTGLCQRKNVVDIAGRPRGRSLSRSLARCRTARADIKNAWSPARAVRPPSALSHTHFR